MVKGGLMNYNEAYLYLFNKLTDLEKELRELQKIAEALAISEGDEAE